MRGPLIALLLALAAAANAQDLLAPLPIRDQFLLNNGFFFFEPQAAGVLDDGDWRFLLHAADSNTFAKSAWIGYSLAGDGGRPDAARELAAGRFRGEGSLFFADGEIHRFEITMRRGFGEHLELGLTLPVTRAGGGWSDPVVESIHHLLSVGNAGRDAVRQNSETVFIETPNVRYLRDRSPGYSLGDIALTGKYELAPLEGKDVRMAIAGAIELPAGDAGALAGSGSVDAGAQMIVSRNFARSAVHASLGFVRLGGDRPLGTHAQMVTSMTLATSQAIGERAAVTAQLTVSESPFRHLGLDELTRRSNQLSIGLQHQLGRSAVAYVAMIENVLNYENSADAAIAWGVSRRF
ncbi:MAG TPA: DUF3187 family protein, partial [Thermoanaerobaculia bacterium]